MRRRRGGDGDRIDELLAELGKLVPPPAEDDLRELARAASAAPRTAPPSRSRRVPTSLRYGIAIAAAALLVGGFGFGLGSWHTESSVAGTSFVGVGFLPAKGWTVVQSGTFRTTGASKAIAATVPLDPDDDVRDAPVATLESLPRNGVLISATFGIRGDPGVDSEFPLRRLPLRVADAMPVSPTEDPLPLTRRLGRYRVLAGVGRYNVDALIYFGSADPKPAQLAVAQSQIEKLVVASERVTLVARPTVHNRNQFVTLLGSVDSNKADEDIYLEGKQCGHNDWTVVDGAHTELGGGYTLRYAQVITTTLRARWNDVRSAPVTVQERAWVQISSRPRTAAGYGFQVEVRSLWQFWKRYVMVQRLDKRLGGWRNVKKVVLEHSGAPPGSVFVWSSGTFNVKVPKGTMIRAVFPTSQARPCYIAGYSNLLST